MAALAPSADIDNDGQVDTTDAFYILLYYSILCAATADRFSIHTDNLSINVRTN